MICVKNNNNNDTRGRKESRLLSNYPRKVVKIRPIGEGTDTYSALVMDSSTSGLGLLTSHYFPEGTKVVIQLDDQYSAIGEVTNREEEWGEWEWTGMSRMGIKFLDTSTWVH